MDDRIQAQLTQAYEMIRAGEKTAAAQILQPISRQHPESVDVWWLLSYALSDPQQVRSALQKVLLLDPFHEQAQQRLDKLVTQTTPAVRATTTTKAVKASPPKRSSSGYVIGLLFVIFAVLGAVGAVFIIMGNQKEEESAAPVQVISVPTVIILPSATITNTFTPAPPTLTPTVTSTYTPVYTLPATWTLVPTHAEPLSLVTRTPWLVESAALATVDPTLFGDTYWEGIGDGFTLEKFTRTGGRHLRFYEFPVKLYVEGGDSRAWQDAIQVTLAQINQVVPMELVETEAEATLVVFIYDPNEYERWSGCPALETAGCATIFDLGDFAGGDTYHRIVGQAFLNNTTVNPAGTMLHEVLHALGVMVHSPDKSDIMYPQENFRASMSLRDLNTLRRLYANPSYND